MKENIEKEDWTTLARAKLNDGDYIYCSAFKGIYHKKGDKLELDLTESDDDISIK